MYINLHNNNNNNNKIIIIIIIIIIVIIIIKIIIIPSLEYNNCYLPRFTTTEKQNHKSPMKNAAYARIPW